MGRQIKWMALVLVIICSTGFSLEGPALDKKLRGKINPKQEKIKSCLSISKNTIIHYAKLFAHLAPDLKKTLGRDAYRVATERGSHCRKQETQRSRRDLLSRHSGRVGIILPLTGAKSQLGLAFKQAMESYLSQFKGSKGRYRILDSHSQSSIFLSHLARYVFIDKVSLLIGGATQVEAQLLKEWSHKLQIPSLIVHNLLGHERTSPYSFHISPSQEQMAETMSRYIFSRGLRQVAIFQAKNRDDRLVKDLTARLQAMGRKVVKVSHIDPNNYQSMEKAVRELFLINAPERADELEKMILAKQAEAKRLKIPFDANDIILPPVMTVDGIVLAESFKTTRHFINIMKFFKIPRLPLIGNQQWRAPELVTPAEPYLEESVFIDYIGNYLRLPYKLQVKTGVSPYFLARGEDSTQVDLGIISRHTIDISQRLISSLPKHRGAIPAILRRLRTRPNDPFFKSQMVFDHRQQSHWPTYIFALRKDQINPMFERGSDQAKLRPLTISRY